MSELAKALAKFHADLPKIGKGSLNPAFKSKYADLADIVAVVLPALAKVDLTWIVTPNLTDEGFVLEYELRHASGDSVKGAWPLPDPTKAKQQELGSAVTYAKRYALSAVTGIAPDEDDDGNAAKTTSGPRRTKEPAGEVIDRAVPKITAAASVEELDELEKLARTRGIHGVPRVVEALQASRLRLGYAPGDAWAVKEPGDG